MRKKKRKVEDIYLEKVLEQVKPLDLPGCRHFLMCGGCSCQNLRYEDQLYYKETMVRDILEPVLCAQGMPKEDFERVFEGIAPSPVVTGYRNKMEFSFGDEVKGGELSLGLHRIGGHYDILNVTDCVIADEDFRLLRSIARDYFGERGISFCHHLTHIGYLRHLLVRKARFTGEILVDIVTTTQAPPEEKALLSDFCEAILSAEREGRFTGRITGILHTKNDSVADVIKNEGTETLYGQDHFFEELLGLKFKITPFSFFQTNSAGAEVLYETAREFIREAFDKSGDETLGQVIYDLYSGTGTIAQILAADEKIGRTGRVIGVEIVEEAVAAARENAGLNGLDNCEFIAGDVMRVLAEERISETPTFVVLDPPREGIHPRALSKIVGFELPYVLYISCKPTSLARDLVPFLAAGYEVKRVRAVDMFPGTRHVETVCLLSNRKPDTKVRIDVDLEDYYRIKDSKKNQN